jgi:monofunctional chorismate mutase
METMGVLLPGMSKCYRPSVGEYTLVRSDRTLTLMAGMFVSESKFQSAPHLFIPHILANPPNTEGLTSLIYKPEVEARLLVRLANKAKIYGGEFDSEGRIVESEGARKIDIEGVVGMYRDYVIPLTKDVEVSTYLIHAAVKLNTRSTTSSTA